MSCHELDPWVRLNVGGTSFTTRKSTLTWPEGSFFERLLCNDGMFAEPELDPDGRIFIDRDPSLFVHILAFLRNRRTYIDEQHVGRQDLLERLRDEARFFLIEDIMFPEVEDTQEDPDEWIEFEYENKEIECRDLFDQPRLFHVSPAESMRLVSSRGRGCITVNGYTLLDTRAYEYCSQEDGIWSPEKDFPLRYCVRNRTISIRLEPFQNSTLRLRYCRSVRIKRSQLYNAVVISSTPTEDNNTADKRCSSNA